MVSASPVFLLQRVSKVKEEFDELINEVRKVQQDEEVSKYEI